MEGGDVKVRTPDASSPGRWTAWCNCFTRMETKSPYLCAHDLALSVSVSVRSFSACLHMFSA